MPKSFYYVCDRCGNRTTFAKAIPEDDTDWRCTECGGDAVWEFTDVSAADHHSRHIRRVSKSRIFRHA